MNTNYLALAFVAAKLTLATTTFPQLSLDEQNQVHEKLAKWKALYGPIAIAHGFVPSATESLDPDQHSQDELERFHNTILDVQDAARRNPLATFSEFNQFALLTPDEFKKTLQRSFGDRNTTAVAAPMLSTGDAAPVDWSTSKCNPPMKNQGSCGSCWAFSTVGTVEFADCLATGTLLDLSEQQVVSCDPKNYGCNGG
ncbi:hypothetical protein As57867_006194, partial [Aphanomyces stellatus]